MSDVSFSVNVCSADAPFAEKTIRHMIRSIAHPFCERIAIFDKGKPEGKYSRRQGADLEKISASLQRLINEGVLDKVIAVPWEDKEIRRIAGKYFDNPDMPLRDRDGAPIYQYLFALDACNGEYILRVDSDMLFHRGESPSWIMQGMQLMENNQEVAFVSCESPPKARNRVERFTGRYFRSPKRKWQYVQTVSTRHFLTNRERLQNVLSPLIPKDEGEALEQTLAETCYRKSLWRARLDFRFGWAVHPLRHNEEFIRNIDSLIYLVEKGEFPFVRPGQHYNLYTGEGAVEPWLDLLPKGGRFSE